MKTKEAIALPLGQMVLCPPDRGSAAYEGRVTHVSPLVHKNIHNVDYLWVTVETLDRKSRHVWPSHRINTV